MAGVASDRIQELRDVREATLPIGICWIDGGQVPGVFDRNLVSGRDIARGTGGGLQSHGNLVLQAGRAAKKLGQEAVPATIHRPLMMLQPLGG
jgi:hypothetical protein